MALVVTVMMAGITGPAVAASESERDAFRQAFSDAVSDPAMMQAVTQIADLGPEKTPRFRRYIEEVMADPAFLGRMTDEIVASGLLPTIAGPKAAFETGFSLGYEIVVAITARNLSKISHDDIQAFFSLMSQMCTLVEPQYCPVMMQHQGVTQEAQIQIS